MWLLVPHQEIQAFVANIIQMDEYSSFFSGELFSCSIEYMKLSFSPI
jgi:hypothetical protein